MRVFSCCFAQIISELSFIGFHEYNINNIILHCTFLYCILYYGCKESHKILCPVYDMGESEQRNSSEWNDDWSSWIGKFCRICWTDQSRRFCRFIGGMAFWWCAGFGFICFLWWNCPKTGRICIDTWSGLCRRIWRIDSGYGFMPDHWRQPFWSLRIKQLHSKNVLSDQFTRSDDWFMPFFDRYPWRVFHGTWWWE